MEISNDLLTKYNVPVPRYTSYPPANHFKETFSESDYLNLLKESNKGKPENIALYIHIPFCRKICYYCGCNACSIGKGDMIIPYMIALKKEIEMVSGYIDKTRLVSQIHYGGGTPNALDISFITSLNDYLFSAFSFIENPEIAIECNPAYLDYQYIDELIACGFNRFSLGIQDFNDEVLRQVNRMPSSIPPGELYAYLKKGGKNNSVNFDFIYGLPGQTVDSFSKTITEAIKIGPDRLVTFSYAHVPWLKKHQIVLEKMGLPSPEDKIQMFLAGYNLLKTSGYQPIGLDHFVLPDDDLYLALNEHMLHRNFQGYCTRRTTGQVYAFGVTAISQLEKGYSQNTESLSNYIASISNGTLPVKRGYILSEEQMLTREIIAELMCNKKINFSEFAETRGMSVMELKNSMIPNETVLKGFVTDGLILNKPDEIEVTEKGTLFIRNIASSFDREYKQKEQTYSKPV